MLKIMKIISQSTNLMPNQIIKNCSSLTQHQKELMSKNLPKQKPITGVEKIIMITSSKGGVGKSTTAVNLATAMKSKQPEKQIGILDADVFGPSIPILMNLNETPLLNKNNLMIPLVNYGIKTMSMGNLVTDKSAVLWRGLMVMQALNKLMREVEWNPCDVLIIDTPPGTGDTHLSLIQNLPIDASIIVTIPDILSLQIAQRGFTMLNKLNIPVAGLIMNMNNVACPKCNHSFELYTNKIERFKQLSELPLLANIPVNKDTSIPAVISDPDSEVSKIYLSLAKKMYEYLELQESRS